MSDRTECARCEARIPPARQGIEHALRTEEERLKTMPNRTGSTDQAVETPTLMDGWSASDTAHFEAFVAACALVAHADGWVTEEERLSASARVRGLNATAVFGVERCLVAFDAAISRFDQGVDVATARAETAILELARQPDAARLVVEAACRVASADGGYDRAERNALLDICQLLNVDPVSFGIVTPDGRR